MRAVAKPQLDSPEQRLHEQLELLTPAQRTRLESSLMLRGIARLALWSSMLFVMPLVGAAVAIGVASLAGLGLGPAATCGFVALSALVAAAYVAVKRLEVSAAAADLARKHRAVASLQLEASSVAVPASSVAVPASSSSSQSRR